MCIYKWNMKEFEENLKEKDKLLLFSNDIIVCWEQHEIREFGRVAEYKIFL